jgi:hypothetical protein
MVRVGLLPTRTIFQCARLQDVERMSHRLVILCVLSIYLAGCQVLRGRLPGSEAEPDMYLPPTAAAAQATAPAAAQSATAASPAAAVEFQATPTPQCINNLRFVTDLTVPDGTQVLPGSLVDKQWQVENNGTCNWDNRYRLKFIAGDDLGAPPLQALYPARSGTQPAIRLTFTAPGEPGTYRSAWQAYSPQDEPFGDPIFVEIIVQVEG